MTKKLLILRIEKFIADELKINSVKRSLSMNKILQELIKKYLEEIKEEKL